MIVLSSVIKEEAEKISLFYKVPLNEIRDIIEELIRERKELSCDIC